MPGPTSGFRDRDRILAMGMAAALVQALEQQALGAGNSGPLGTGQFFGSQGNIFVYSGPNAGNGADTTEDTLASFTLAANALDAVGRGLVAYFWGSYANNVDVKNARFRFGASISVQVATGQNVGWVAEAMIIKSGANTQTGNGQTISGATHGGTTLPLAGTEVDTAGIVCKVTGQAGTANANDIVLSAGFITFMN